MIGAMTIPLQDRSGCTCRRKCRHRISWYFNNGDASTNDVYKNYKALTALVSKCVENKMIPLLKYMITLVLMILQAIISLNTWWTQDSVFTDVLLKYKESVTVNYETRLFGL